LLSIDGQRLLHGTSQFLDLAVEEGKYFFGRADTALMSDGFQTGWPVTASPDEVVPPSKRNLVLKIKVNRVTLLFDVDVVTVVPVVVHLEA
jgi:hypothetical protein